MKRRLQLVLFFVALMVALGLAVYLESAPSIDAAQTFSGPGLFISRSACADIVNPVSGQTWCFDATNQLLDVWNGTGFVQANPITLGVNGGTGGKITLNGSTSGSVAVSAAAAAGTGTKFLLPATNGTNAWVLQTDGTGVTSWVAGGSAFPAGTSLTFGGSFLINGSTPTGFTQAANVMKATRGLTVDNCYAVWATLGSCSTFPSLVIADVTASTTVCSVVGTGTTTATSVSLTNPTINSGDVVELSILQPPVGCAATPQYMTLGMTYH